MTDLTGASVVVTGASSGIGRATARAFAERGARLTLAARRGEVLEDVARECRDRGGQAIAVPTDVADPDSVRALARAAVQAWGGIDVWVNNAGVGAVGAFHEVPLEMHRQIIETDLMGAIHGAEAVVPVFLRQGRGTLVNNISMGAWTPMPFASAYTAAKFGLRGFTASLRQELKVHPEIHVCGVFPSMIDTPGLQHGANLSGKRINPGPYLYSPERVARAIVGVVRHPRAEVAVGFPAGWARFAYGVAPVPTEHAVGLMMRRALERAGPGSRREGAVMHPTADGVRASGGVLERKGVPPAERLNGFALIAAGAALSLGALAFARARRTG
ncbi:SDR family oxidoreductase [Rubellimicrobium roseum]|uniref:SDR family oxidoreductase n=1 Tax=Rubellimicrobium roseum TaxID=687525 RepID=A0A5C4ND16_9RHOB|nr:SDR family oxidoreductase [Rubellimicrobium roseum]TNC70899.1 SDR family oxidoreductase [Rubellimicrobium roseum]